MSRTASVNLSDHEHECIEQSAAVYHTTVSGILRDCLRRCGFRIAHRQDDPPWTETQQHGNNETGEDK